MDEHTDNRTTARQAYAAHDRATAASHFEAVAADGLTADLRGEWDEAERKALQVGADLDANRIDYDAEAWYVVAEATPPAWRPECGRCVR